MKIEAVVGSLYPVWWFTGIRVGEWNMARVLDVQPYTGKFTEWFNVTLILYAPRTKAGSLPMAVKL